MIELIGKWIVYGWLGAHMICWISVELTRLIKATVIKIKRILQQEVAEE